MQLSEKHLSAALRRYRPGRSVQQLARFVLPAAFLCFVVPLSIVLASITPPGAGPDELTHAMRADSLRSGELLAARRMEQSADGPQVSLGLRFDHGIFSAGTEMDGGHRKATIDIMQRIGAVGWTGHREYMPRPSAAPYPPILYVPAAIGIGLTKLEGGSPLDAYKAARLANTITFAVLGVLALLTARRGQAILFWALAVPMTASLAALVSQDGMLIGGAALAMALLTRADAIDPTTGRPGRAWVAAAVLIGILAADKPPYACLAAGLLLPLHSVDRRLVRRAGYAALALLPAVLWTGFAMWRLSVPLLNVGSYHPGPLWPGAPDATFHATNAAAQLQVLAVKPWRPFWLTWHTIMQDPWLARMIIGVLGCLEIVLPQWLYTVWGVAAVTACLAATLSQAAPDVLPSSSRDSLVVLGAAVLGVVAIYMALYLSWTRVGETIVTGVQGRYILPLIPMLALGLPSLRVKQGDTLATLLGLPGVVAAMIGLASVPPLIVATFYLR